jgi:zinc transport system substrate-binding protein
MQADFLEWAGLNVIGTYGEADSLTLQVVKDLVDDGKAARVSLVIDNLQNGADAGEEIAEELGAKRITISNFPGGFADTETWEKAIEKNIELILNAIGE